MELEILIRLPRFPQTGRELKTDMLTILMPKAFIINKYNY